MEKGEECSVIVHFLDVETLRMNGANCVGQLPVNL